LVDSAIRDLPLVDRWTNERARRREWQCSSPFFEQLAERD
jgi:hypothetical protein